VKGVVVEAPLHSDERVAAEWWTSGGGAVVEWWWSGRYVRVVLI